MTITHRPDMIEPADPRYWQCPGWAQAGPDMKKPPGLDGDQALESDFLSGEYGAGNGLRALGWTFLYRKWRGRPMQRRPRRWKYWYGSIVTFVWVGRAPFGESKDTIGSSLVGSTNRNTGMSVKPISPANTW